MILEARDLSLAYRRDPVVAGLSVRIVEGRVTALVGANASGKSTLLRGLARLLRPARGAVYLDGRRIDRVATREVARRMAVLPQGPEPPEGVTVRELVAHGRYPHQRMLRQFRSEDELAVERALSATGLLALADRPLDELSGGQRQHAWIAMTLAQETQVMLLDEPTTYLDMAHQVRVLDLLRRLNAQDGRTIVMVLHDLNQAARYADEILAIRAGRLAAAGAPAEVVTEETVRAVFGLDVHVIEDPATGGPLVVPAAGGPVAAPAEARPAEGDARPAPARRPATAPDTIPPRAGSPTNRTTAARS